MLKSNKYIMLICKDKLMFSDLTNGKSTLEIENIDICPNTPFYHYLWEPNLKYNIIGDLKVDKKSFKRNDIFCLIPDDANFTDKKIIEEFSALKFNSKNIINCFQAQVIETKKGDFVSISKTSRCIALTYIKNYGKNKEIFIEKNSSIDEIKKAIYEIKIEDNSEDIPVYINNVNEDMYEFNELGNLVGINEFFNNAKEVFKMMKLK